VKCRAETQRLWAFELMTNRGPSSTKVGLFGERYSTVDANGRRSYWLVGGTRPYLKRHDRVERIPSLLGLVSTAWQPRHNTTPSRQDMASEYFQHPPPPPNPPTVRGMAPCVHHYGNGSSPHAVGLSVRLKSNELRGETTRLCQSRVYCKWDNPPGMVLTNGVFGVGNSTLSRLY
jgi:hypothetical protein